MPYKLLSLWNINLSVQLSTVYFKGYFPYSPSPATLPPLPRHPCKLAPPSFSFCPMCPFAQPPTFLILFLPSPGFLSTFLTQRNLIIKENKNIKEI